MKGNELGIKKREKVEKTGPKWGRKEGEIQKKVNGRRPGGERGKKPRSKPSLVAEDGWGDWQRSKPTS